MDVCRGKIYVSFLRTVCIVDTVDGPLKSVESGVAILPDVTKTGTSWLVLAQKPYAQQLLLTFILFYLFLRIY